MNTQRYAILSRYTWPAWHGDAQTGIAYIMQGVNMEDDEWQIGRTKIFIKSPESVSTVLLYIWFRVYINLSLAIQVVCRWLTMCKNQEQVLLQELRSQYC